MKRIARAAGVVAAVTVGIAAFGTGTAAARDPLAGKTYAQAVATVSSWGKGNGKTIIATVNGSQLPTDDCIVTSSFRGIFKDSIGTNRGGEFYVNLDCNKSLAGPGHPGNSIMSPEGRQAKEDEANAEYVAKHPETCEKNDNTAKWCADLCTKTGLCDFSA